MPIDLENEKTPIDPTKGEYTQMLENLQGNILKGHGRDHTVHIFIKLDGEDAKANRRNLGEVAKLATSARQQHRESEQFQRYRIPGALFFNLFLTARGYKSLGFADKLEEAFPEPDGDFGVRSNFLEGMRAHGDELNDPSPEVWDEGYKKDEIDAMLLLADDDEGFLLREARRLIAFLETFSTVLVVERGDALRTDSGEGIEHFGYVDGRSQPIYLTTDLFDKGGKSKEGNTDKWNPVEKLSIVLVPDRLAGGAADAFGSYFVFRKLEQDVRRFKIREEQLADELGLKDEERERAGAMAVGRFEDGTPLALSQTDGFIPTKENNFTYADDPAGFKCPFHAHIRKSNPRGETGDATERARRLTRRGITYGERKRDPDDFLGLQDLPTKDVGLLFMCFQSSIANQFAFIQKLWVNNEDFVAGETGLDPIIGQASPAEPPIQQRWPIQYGEQPDPDNPGGIKPPDTKPFSFDGFVKLKGGEFFFAPSIPFLKSLAAGD